MHARRQVDEAQYSAARAYQRLYDCATIGNLSPADLLRPRVDGGQAPDPISAARMAAATRLRSVEGTLKDWHGFAGLVLTRCAKRDSGVCCFGNAWTSWPRRSASPVAPSVRRGRSASKTTTLLTRAITVYMPTLAISPMRGCAAASQKVVLPRCFPSAVLGSNFEIMSLYFQQFTLRIPLCPKRTSAETGLADVNALVSVICP